LKEKFPPRELNGVVFKLRGVQLAQTTDGLFKVGVWVIFWKYLFKIFFKWGQ